MAYILTISDEDIGDTVCISFERLKTVPGFVDYKINFTILRI